MSDIAPNANKVQQQSVQFDKPVGEASLASIGGLANYLREIILPVGSIVDSMLTEAQFQTENVSGLTRWIIADGRSVAGSAYEAITGFSNVPDLRGIATRGKNGTRSDGNQNPDGDLALGTFTPSRFGSHSHGLNDPGHNHTPYESDNFLQWQNGGPSAVNGFLLNGLPVRLAPTTATSGTGITMNATGGADTSPSNVTVNKFIRIN